MNPKIEKRVVQKVIRVKNLDRNLLQFMDDMNRLIGSIPDQYQKTATITYKKNNDNQDTLEVSYIAPKNADDFAKEQREAVESYRAELQYLREDTERLKRLMADNENRLKLLQE